MAPSELQASSEAIPPEILVHLIDPPACKPSSAEEEKTWQQKWTTLAVQSWKSLPRFISVVSLVQVWTLIFLGDMGAHWFMYNPAKKSELWRLLTYMAVHTGPIHLALNVVIQCLLAWPLETEQTTCRVAVLYFAGGIAGSMGTAALEPGVSVVGASAGVYALLISHLAHLALNWHLISYRWYRTAAVLVLVVADIAASLHHHFRFGNACPRVGWAAHYCGAFAGLLVGLIIYRQSDPVKPEAARHVRSIRLAAVFLLAAVTVTVLLSKLPSKKS